MSRLILTALVTIFVVAVLLPTCFSLACFDSHNGVPFVNSHKDIVLCGLVVRKNMTILTQIALVDKAEYVSFFPALMDKENKFYTVPLLCFVEQYHDISETLLRCLCSTHLCNGLDRNTTLFNYIQSYLPN
ncbi:hypothetical protein L596_001649 [Steinernema carpocapsae]|uniref:ZP domain-containing protein n=1 Tax=Steinernema carpocapsae TaxID=34508 RepID=A0A4U8UM51_STECR|nr:hypothetical protein L596_001649 [Steinernema carpocapsae]